MATFGRGELILPSIRSVLKQTDTDFELIVVGDGCTDATQQAVEAIGSPKVTWCNLPSNSGSQSAPNNEGIRRARGSWICYLGHDDIWASDHLATVRAVIHSDSEVSFAVSGCIYYGPPGSEVHVVTGLFDDGRAASEHFFPPSSLAHVRSMALDIGGWHHPRSISLPVDSDFVLRAAGAGARFASTGRVTVHKFAAGHRYLSYLRPSAEEQQDLLRRLPGLSERILDGLVAKARMAGSFMVARHERGLEENGAAFDRNRENKGLKRPELVPLSQRLVVPQTDESRGLDWFQLEHGDRPFRWSGPNPNPKILLPFTGTMARVSLHVAGHAPNARLEDVGVATDNAAVATRVDTDEADVRWLSFITPLSADDYTVVTLHTPQMFQPGGSDTRRLGVAVADMVVEPLA